MILLCFSVKLVFRISIKLHLILLIRKFRTLLTMSAGDMSSVLSSMSTGLKTMGATDSNSRCTTSRAIWLFKLIWNKEQSLKTEMSRNVQEKICLWGFRPGLTQTKLYSHKRCLEAWNFRLRKERDCTIYQAKTKVLISCKVTVKLICVFDFRYAKSRFSLTWID